MTDHDAFLQALAANPDDDAARLVYADWLDEGGDPRGEFLRVQCALTAADLPAERRQALRVRERELLNAHRQEWCQEYGLPVEDVAFERGLIARLRLAQWDGGRLLDPEFAARLLALTELDVSGLGIDDEGLAAFARSARLPALRKLILSDNHLTDAGAAALVAAPGLPRLDTVYFFGNQVSAGARRVLEQSSAFRLATLDVGDRAEGYCLSPGETDVARRRYLRQRLLPVVTQYFATYERLQSAMLCVAQYWCDEATDAVHNLLIVSELFEPTLEGVGHGWDEDVPDPNLPTTHLPSRYGKGSSSAVNIWDDDWEDNGRAIPLWAAFAPEEGSQEYGEYSEVYAPAVMFYRHGGYDLLPMRRPHLDGVRPEWGWDE